MATWSLMFLTIVPAVVFRKERDKLFIAGMSGIERKTADIAKNIKPSITAKATVNQISISSTPTNLSSQAMPSFVSSDFSQLRASMSADISEADFLEELLSQLQKNETLWELYSKSAGVSEGIYNT